MILPRSLELDVLVEVLRHNMHSSPNPALGDVSVEFRAL